MKTFITLTLSLIFLSFQAYAEDNAQSVYERVISSGKIRCGYIIYPPAVMKDPATGALSGVFYDFMNEIGKNLSLEVEWVQESGWGTFIQDLKADRFDMMCAAAWANSARAREADSLKGLYYSAISAWVRKDDSRFEQNISTVNDPVYKIAGIDGETATFIANTDFPKAQLLSLTDLSSVSDLLLSVNTGKADMTFIEDYIAQEFLAKNPGTVKRIGAPLRVYPNSMWIKKGEDEFRTMINSAIEESLNSGLLERIFAKYGISRDMYRMPAKPYAE